MTIAAGGVAWSRYQPGEGVEIILPPDSAVPSHPETSVPAASTQKQPQKIDINRAEAWLLEALPGIGEVKAQAIIAYRRQHGPFLLTTDLLKVEGISTSVYEKIKDLITVGD